ncbi:MAG: MoaD/ThiS family protein [Chitinophagales bacterium]
MNLTILGFGIAKEIFGGASISIELSDKPTVVDLKHSLQEKYPRLKQLSTFMIAVNNRYASSDEMISPTDEIAIIPPVSGG